MATAQVSVKPLPAQETSSHVSTKQTRHSGKKGPILMNKKAPTAKKISHTEVSPLLPPFNIPLAIRELGYEVADRANAIAYSFANEECMGYYYFQSIFTGEEFQDCARGEAAMWPTALDSLAGFYGKPLTREMAFQILGPAMAAVAISAVNLQVDKHYLGSEPEEGQIDVEWDLPASIAVPPAPKQTSKAQAGRK